MKQITLIALLLGGLFNHLNVQAAATWAAVSLRGKLIVPAPPATCTLSMSSNSVHFGDVLSSRIDGYTYRRMPLPYTLACDRTPNGALTITLSGTPATFGGGSGVLRTSINNLGVAFYNGNVQLTLNNALAFSYTNQPTLFAVPTKAAGATFSTGGYFTAAATLIVNYS